MMLPLNAPYQLDFFLQYTGTRTTTPFLQMTTTLSRRLMAKLQSYSSRKRTWMIRPRTGVQQEMLVERLQLKQSLWSMVGLFQVLNICLCISYVIYIYTYINCIYVYVHICT